MKECIGVVAGCSGETIAEELLKRGYEVALIAGREGERGVDTATHVLVSDLSVCATIKDFFRQHDVTKVIMGTGHILAINLMAYLENHGFVCSINPATALIAKDKIEYRKALQNAGISTMKFMHFDRDTIPSLTEIVETVGIPCVVKSPLDFMYPQKANSIDELRDCIDKVIAVDTVLIEQYIFGFDYTVAVTNDGNDAKVWTIAYYSKAKEVKLKGFSNIHEGIMTPEMEIDAKEVARHAVQDIGLIGLPRLDMISTLDGKHHVLECNSVSVTGYDTPYVDFEKAVLRAVPERYVDLLIDTSMVVFDNKLKSRIV